MHSKVHPDADTQWYFDGYNVLHAVLLGRERDVAWWHREFQRRVVCWVETLCTKSPIVGAPVTVVFDALRQLSPAEAVSSDRISVVYAPDADEWIVQSCRRSERVHVVSADRGLIERVKATGAKVSKPWVFEMPRSAR